MVPRHRDVYCVPGSNLTDTVIEFTERMVGNKPEISVRLKGFKENDVTNVGEFVPLTGIPRMNFYRLNQNNEIETDVLSGRDKVEVGGVEQKIRLAGTKETLGASSTNKGEIDNFISNPTANQKNLNRLKILVPHKDL
jgi:hypothetical protein